MADDNHSDTNHISVATFSRLASGYAEKYFELALYDSHLHLFAAKLARGGRLLDLACGPGNVCAYFARERPDIACVGIDLAEGMLAEARKRVPNAEFLLRDCRRLNDLGPAFDAAAFAFGLNYFTDTDARDCFESLTQVLTPAARIYVATMTGEPSESGFAVTSSGDQVHLTYRNSEEILAMIECAGFVIERADIVASPLAASKQTRDLIVIAQRQ